MARVLGLDLGSHSLKGMLLEATGRGTSVLHYAETRRREEAPLDEALAVFLAENPWAPDQVVVALPGPSLATHAFTLPFTDAKRIGATLPFEVEGELPFELSQVVFDHQVTRRRANATDLVVGLVRREELAELLRALAARGLDPRVVTHPAIAYQNLFLAAPERFEVAPGAAVAVLDIGHRRTSIAVGRPAEGLLFARTFPGGGRDLSRALAAEFQVPLAEAEAWKERDGSLTTGGGPEHVRARAVLVRALAPLVREIRATLKAASGRERVPVARLLLAGGTAQLPGLIEHLGTELGLPADVLLLPANAAGVVPPEVQPRAAQAYALSLRGTMASGRAPRFNLRQGEFAFRGHVDYLRQRLVRVAAFAAVLALLLCVFNVTRGVLLGRREAAVDARLCALTQRVLGGCEKNYDRALNLLRGQQSPATAVPPVSATRLLAEVAQRVPPEVTVNFNQMVFDLNRVQLRGETDSTRSIDKIAAALKTYRCFREVKEGKVERARESSRVQFQLDVQVECGDAVASAGSGS
ncbi:MAG TPA: pilus assembly protein PilM [Myxococcaceae bacterium]|nr:pilus assembly protein PilM [Myxococcaceae bacterium]